MGKNTQKKTKQTQIQPKHKDHDAECQWNRIKQYSVGILNKKTLRFFWRLVIYMEAMQACDMDSDLGVFRWRGGQFWIQPKKQRTVDEILPFRPFHRIFFEDARFGKKIGSMAGNGHIWVRGKYAVVKAWIRAVGEICGLVQTSSHSDFSANVQRDVIFLVGSFHPLDWFLENSTSTPTTGHLSQWLIAGPAKKSTSLWSHVAKMSSVRKLLWDCLLWVIFVGQSLNIQDGGDIGCYPPTIMVQRWSQWACFGRIKHLESWRNLSFYTEAWLVCTCEFHDILAPESFTEMFTEKLQLPTSRAVV